MTLENDIKKALKQKKLLIGSRSVLSAVKAGKTGSLVYARNIPKQALGDVQHYASLAGVEAMEFPGNSVQLGEICGKPFNILLLGILK
jgi:large subunit ribosomal protein L30e